MSAVLCIWCARRLAVEPDHLVDPDSDPLLTVPSCRPCNYPLGVQLWRAASLDTIGDTHPAIFRLKRLAFAYLRLGDCGRPMVELPAETCIETGRTLIDIASELEERER